MKYEKNYRYDILVFGETNVDLILRGDDLVPSFGQAEKLVDDATLDLGGSSGIFACGAGRLGLSLGFVGKLGNDEFGTFLKKTLNDRGVDTEHMIIDPQLKTGLTLHLSRTHDRAMLTYPGTIAALKPEDVDVNLFEVTRHIHFSSYFLQTGMQENLAELFHQAKKAGVTISLDPGWDPENNWNGYLDSVLDQVDIFMPNDQEALKITASSSIEEALIKLNQKIPLSVIKMGRKGASASNKSGTLMCNAFQVQSLETTGAGDSFNAGFLYAYLNSYDLEDCLRWGCACGAISTTKVGGIAGQPTVAEVEAFISDKIK